MVLHIAAKIALLLLPVGMMVFAWESVHEKEEKLLTKAVHRVKRSAECELSLCARPDNIVGEPDFAVGFSDEFVGLPAIEEDAVLRLQPHAGDDTGLWCAHYREVPTSGRFFLRVRPLLGLELYDLHVRCFAEDGRRWKTRQRPPVRQNSQAEFIVDLH